MSLMLREAIFDRWGAAGLDESIAPLYPGDSAAAPEGTGLPRAEYSLPADRQRARSRGSRELLQPLRFQVWANDDRTVQQFVDLIESMYVDSEAAGADPLVLSAAAGTILAVDYLNKTVVQENEAVFRGTLDLQIQWARANAGT